MINTAKSVLLVAGGLLIPVLPPCRSMARAETGSQAFFCRHQEAQPRSQPSPGSGRQYAPDRLVDILHVALDLTPDFKKRSVSGQMRMRFEPIAKPLTELRLDGVDLAVHSVSSSRDLLAWQATDEEVIFTFAQPIPVGEEASLVVHYSATPQEGLYFRTPEMGYPPQDAHLWTQGEAIQARHWYPCYDFPNEKFTSEITCRVPAGMVVLSNGRKLSEVTEEDTGRVAVRWLQDKPHVSYLLTLVAGHFKGIEDRHGDVPLAFYTPASQIQYAAASFAGTKDMLAFFEEEIGVPYPWDKYDQVCVLDFHWGGMENTSQTTLNISTLHTPDTENLRSSQGLVAHELAHQWFGDLVTCKDWSHLWINEGFATYYEALYDGHQHGQDQLRYRLYQSAKMIARQPNDTQAMVRRDFKDPSEQFGFLAYPKGAWILHMLRCQLGADLYRRCVTTFVERHRFGNAETADWVAILEEQTGRSFDQFFDQYVYHAHHPELSVQYRWDDQTKLAKMSVRQKQKLSDNVLLFRVPLPIRFLCPSGTRDCQIHVSRESEDFYFPLPEAPELVRVDPELTLLADIDFDPPTRMLHGQLTNTQDALGRVIAAEKLGAKKESGTVDRLKQALQQDAFYGVRIEASRALRALGSDEAMEALLASAAQEDARVRRQVAQDIASVYGESSCQAMLRCLEQEKNPDIQAVALQAIGIYSTPEVREALLSHLGTDSFRNSLASAAIQGMQRQDDPTYVGPLLQYLEQHESDFFSARSFGQALHSLAFLAREAEDKSPVRQFLLGHLEHKKRQVRLASIGALGTLGDTKALAALETFTHHAEESPESKAAEKAAAQLRESRPVSPELTQLRKEVLDLQKENRQLREDLDDLKKKWESWSSQASAVQNSKEDPKKSNAEEPDPGGTDRP